MERYTAPSVIIMQQQCFAREVGEMEQREIGVNLEKFMAA